MTVRYGTWKDHSTQTYEVVMWDDGQPFVIKSGIKIPERARKLAAQYNAKERAADA